MLAAYHGASTRVCTLNWILKRQLWWCTTILHTKILMRAISNVQGGRRFPTPDLQTKGVVRKQSYVLTRHISYEKSHGNIV